MTLDFSRCRSVPVPSAFDDSITMSGVLDHVKIGVQALLDHPYFFITDPMGLMKTAQVIIASQFLFEQGTIDKVLVIAPASVRQVWYDPELGELAKHLFVSATITEFHQRKRNTWIHAAQDANKENPKLAYGITNYEWVRAKIPHKGQDKETQLALIQKASTLEILNFCGPKTLLVLDESTAVSSHDSAQTLACMALRYRCGRVVLLNGTPVGDSIQSLFSQGNLLHPSILACPYITHFKARYASQEVIKKRNGTVLMTSYGAPVKKVTAWINESELQARFKPFVLRREKRDCLDLPEALPPVTASVPLNESWPPYKQMRKEMVVWLKDNLVATAPQIIVKLLRLSQITSGYVGGIENEDGTPAAETTQVVGREKLDFILTWWQERLLEDKNLKLLVWCRFRPELERMIREVSKLNLATVGQIHGGQKRADRDEALRLLDPRTAPSGPVFFAGTYGTGALGINLTACHTVVNLSYDFSLYKYLQSAARVDRPGQVHAVSTVDVEAVGPAMQETIDHQIIRARRLKQNIAEWTTRAWLSVLEE